MAYQSLRKGSSWPSKDQPKTSAFAPRPFAPRKAPAVGPAPPPQQKVVQRVIVKGEGKGEYFDDADGYRTGLIQKWKEVTATLGFAPAPPIELRFEWRGDWSDNPVFVKDAGSYSPGSGWASTSDRQNQVAVEALFRF